MPISMSSSSQGVKIYSQNTLMSYVTWSDKKGLIAHDRKSNFLSALWDFSVRISLW